MVVLSSNLLITIFWNLVLTYPSLINSMLLKCLLQVGRIDFLPSLDIEIVAPEIKE